MAGGIFGKSKGLDQVIERKILDMLKMSFTSIAIVKNDDKQLLRKEKVYPQGYEYR